MARHRKAGQIPVVIHLRDHDPSGIDMSGDVCTRLEMFVGTPIEFRRIALNTAQVQRYNPPPNPAKATDTRFETYQRRFGPESWELDALEPQVLSGMIWTAIAEYRDDAAWDVAVEREDALRAELATAAANWERLADQVVNLEPGKVDSVAERGGADVGLRVAVGPEMRV